MIIIYLKALHRLVSKELYNISPCPMYQKPTSHSYYEELLETTNLSRKYTFYQEKFLQIQIFACFSTKFWMILSFPISYFSILKKFHYHSVLFATLQMKRHCISSILVILTSDCGTNFNILFLSIFIFLKSLHRVPSSNSFI